MIHIENLQEYYRQDKIIISIHAQERLRQRGIKQKDIRSCVMTGEIIEQYPEDFPFPSCLVFGYTICNKVLHVVVSDEGSIGRIITAYYPSNEKFEDEKGEATMRCMSCKYGEMQEAATTYFTRLHDCYVIIENVPCLKCNQCGEEFLIASAAEKIDMILDKVEKITSKIFILDYTTAA